MQEQRAALFEALQELVHEQGFVYALCEMLWHDQFYKASESADVNWRERLNVQEINYLVGWLIKRPLDLGLPPLATLTRDITRTRELLEQLHSTYLQPYDP